MNYPGNKRLLKTLETSKEQIKELIDNDYDHWKELIDNDIDYDSNNEFISNYSALTDLLENIEWSIQYLKDRKQEEAEARARYDQYLVEKYDLDKSIPKNKTN
jgi:hypothetical protein